MRRIIIAALLLASCATVQKPVQAPDYATLFADALCDRNASYIAANATGRIADTEADIADYFSMLPDCTEVRFIAADSGGFLFVLREGGVPIPYLFTFDAAHQATDVR